MADIKKELNAIKNAVYGKEVRGAIHDGIKKINDEVENATDLSESAKHQVKNIQQQVNQLVVEGDSSVEAAQARVDADNNVYATLKERLDTKETQFALQLEHTSQKIAMIDENLEIMKKGVFNVQDYGAQLDGITDDTQAFQNCADAIRANSGGVFYIPFADAGIVISGTVSMPSNVIVEGNNNLIIASSPNNLDTPFLWENESNIYVRDLRINGMKELKNPNQSVAGGSNGITLKGECNNIKVLNCHIFNTLEHGVHLLGVIATEPDRVLHCNNVEINGCLFENNGNPDWTDGPRGAGIMMILGQENVKIQNNTFKNFVRVGIYADSAFATNLDELYPGLSIDDGNYTGKDIFITNNEFFVDTDYWGHVTSGDSGVGIAIHGQQRLSVENNKIKLLAGKYRGISIDDSQESSPTDNIVISKNYIESNFPCIQLNDASYINIEGNHLINLAGTHDTIRIEYSTRTVEEIVLKNNHIRNKEYAGIYIFNEFGTTVDLKGIFIIDNRITNTTNTVQRSAGIWLSREMDDIVLKGNVIRRGYFGITVGMAATNVFVKDNNISSCNTAINSTAPLVVAFNIIHGCVNGIVATNPNAKTYNNIENGVMN